MARFWHTSLAGLSCAAITLNMGLVGAGLASPVADHGALSVAGNRIIDAHHVPTRLNGVSFFGLIAAGGKSVSTMEKLSMALPSNGVLALCAPPLALRGLALTSKTAPPT